MANASQIINQAKSWLWANEKDGSHKKIIDIYNTINPLPRNYKAKYIDSWCAIFVSAVAKQCNALDVMPAECSCGEMIKLCQAKGIWQEDENVTPKTGDIIFYDWDGKNGWPDHVGIVESVSGGVITAIEGNKNDSVERRKIVVGNKLIRGYATPRYEAETQPIPTPSNKIEEDGKWGTKTTERAQQVFGAVIDGIVSNQYSAYKSSNPGLLSSTFEWEKVPGKSGSLLIKKIQKFLGIKEDGFIGPKTIKAMQTWLGTTVDGVCDKTSDMVKAFQKWLNAQ